MPHNRFRDGAPQQQISWLPTVAAFDLALSDTMIYSCNINLGFSAVYRDLTNNQQAIITVEIAVLSMEEPGMPIFLKSYL